MQVVEVGAYVEVELIVGREEAVIAQQSFAASIEVGQGRADLVPRAAAGIVAKLRERNGNIGSRAAETGVENMR
jgi:hypothetical protein